MSPDPHAKAARDAGNAWKAYRSTCMLGGTREQRKWACQQAVKAEEQLAKVEQAVTPLKSLRKRPSLPLR